MWASMGMRRDKGKTRIGREGRRTHLRNAYSFSQNSGLAIVAWYGVSDTDAGDAGIVEVSSTSGMSTNVSPGVGVSDGDGDSTTDGIRPCPLRVFVGSGLGSSVIPSSFFPSPWKGDEGEAAGAGATLDGSHSKPGLIMRLMVSPSLTAYSWRSFASARALPFSRSRCASAGGAPVVAASWVLICAMVSVGWTESV